MEYLLPSVALWHSYILRFRMMCVRVDAEANTFPFSFAQQELCSNNTTHFTVEELERLLAAFKRVTEDRLQVRAATRLSEFRLSGLRASG